MRIRLQVYLDGLRDDTHRCAKEYDNWGEAALAANNALNDLAVSEVRFVKIK